jgi:PhoPQ-activated pathogenicity-related protein
MVAIYYGGGHVTHFAQFYRQKDFQKLKTNEYKQVHSLGVSVQLDKFQNS